MISVKAIYYRYYSVHFVMVIKLSLAINLNSLWLPIKVMKAIIGDQTNKIIEINLIWPTYGGSNARPTLLLLSNMRQKVLALNSISFYSTIDYTVLVRWTIMKTVYDNQYVHTPFSVWFTPMTKKQIPVYYYSIILHPILKNVWADDNWGRPGSNLRTTRVLRRVAKHSMCLYKIIFMFDNSLHNAVYFLLCQ